MNVDVSKVARRVQAELYQKSNTHSLLDPFPSSKSPSQYHVTLHIMSSTKDSLQENITVGNDKQVSNTSPTIVVISSNTAAENIVAALKSDSNAVSAVPDDEGFTDATDLTKEQWMRILCANSYSYRQGLQAPGVRPLYSKRGRVNPRAGNYI